ncbi:hypothetical protein TanjilG_09174 [Lupinus angustifolius]|uniref:NAD(P)-binding domain-containing protein n=1 Tax=Lupinus angustifolius TaxID=3871 RepID=A0A394DEZ6_LUPAN|nr:hypothetical protein TanjilG_09174 [Lupinus angustifolius]
MAAPLFLRTPTFHTLKPFTLPSTFNIKSVSILNFAKMEGSEIVEQVQENLRVKKVFVAGATGSTGKRIVEQLLAKGFAVKAGVRDLDKARTTFSSDNPSLQLVKADVTEGSDKLAEAIGDDSEAVVCATGFRPGWDLLAPWKKKRLLLNDHEVTGSNPGNNLFACRAKVAYIYPPQDPLGGSLVHYTILILTACSFDITPLVNDYIMQVDNFGTVNLVEACRKRNVNRFILISSILVNGAAMGQLLNPAYIFLNVFGLTLVAKLQAEQYIRKSGINYTIIRPGGLRNDPPSGNVVLEPEDTLSRGNISRDQVAEVAVEALALPEASYKVVEIISSPDVPKRSYHDLFGSISQR